MKKFLALLLMAVMAVSLFTGCSDPLYDEFENFLNVQMVDVNANYEKIKTETGTWAEMEDTASLASSIKDAVIPLVEDSLAKMAEINPETEEVKDLKAKYIKVMDAYKEGFSLMLEAVETDDAEKAETGNQKVDEGIKYLDEYNAALEALAEQVGAEIEY